MLKLWYIVKEEDIDTKSQNNKNIFNVNRVLREKLFVSDSLIKQNEKDILLNGVPVLRKEKVNVGDKVEVILKENINPEDWFVNKYECRENNLDVIYEDEYFLAVNKPYGIPIHPSCANYIDTLANYVAAYLDKKNIHGIHIVTRLDKDTSGVCIFAKSPYVQELFNIKKEEICFSKEYICIVNGKMEEETGKISEPIARKEGSIIQREVNPNGQYALTEYWVIKYNEKENYSVLRVKLHTGRTHQIRVHMSHIGHTLLGDEIYATENEVKNIRNKITRQALHANAVSFFHPITNKKIVLEAKVPEDMLKLM